MDLTQITNVALETNVQATAHDYQLYEYAKFKLLQKNSYKMSNVVELIFKITSIYFW